MKKNNRHKAIGIFDSGMGGLTVVKALMKKMPSEKIVYYGDTARVPYGTKSKSAIVRFSEDNAKMLLRHDVKVIVVACNSSSSYAIGHLRKKFKVPIIGVIVPGSKKAVSESVTHRIGVIATQATVQSGAYQREIKKLNKNCKTFAQSCPLFVPLAEAGWGDKNFTREIAREYLKGFKNKKIDTLILGCTHYPLLKQSISKVLGSKVNLIDSANEVVDEVALLLTAKDLTRQTKGKGSLSIMISDRPQGFEQLAKNFLGASIKKITRIKYV